MFKVLSPRNLCIGAVAGLTGSAAMHLFRLWWESVIGNRNKQGIYGFDHEADVNASRLLARLLGESNLSEQEAAQLGLALHYALGTVFGSIYAGNIRGQIWLRKGNVAVLGAALWVCADEVPISIAGISNPFRKNIPAHASALAAHLLFGFTVVSLVEFFQGHWRKE